MNLSPCTCRTGTSVKGRTRIYFACPSSIDRPESFLGIHCFRSLHLWRALGEVRKEREGGRVKGERVGVRRFKDILLDLEEVMERGECRGEGEQAERGSK